MTQGLAVLRGGAHWGAHSPRKCAIFYGIVLIKKNNFWQRKSPQTLIYQGFPDFFVAGAEGLEPSARGFGDRCSTN